MNNFPYENLWTIVDGYLVSTADTPDKGLETMVFPPEENSKIEIIDGTFCSFIKGADFGNPVDKYTRHYDSVDEAKQGHRAIVKAIKEEANETT
jgi:hypothetical protein